MSWIEHHQASEQLASEAQAALREDRQAAALALYARAADAEHKALTDLDASKARTSGITAVSTASLYYKAAKLERAESVAGHWVGVDYLPSFAKEQLRGLLQSIWVERTINLPPISELRTIMNATEELEQIVERLERLAKRGDDPSVAGPLAKLQASAQEVAKSASGSWLGYHAHIYYEGFTTTPPDAHFDQEWGLMDRPYSNRTFGSWKQYAHETVVEAIYKKAENPDLSPARKFDDDAKEVVNECRLGTLSVLQVYADVDDKHWENVRSKIGEISPSSGEDIIRRMTPPSRITRDTMAANQGQIPPPHICVYAEILAIRHNRKAIGDLTKLVKHVGSHLLRRQKQAVSGQRSNVGTKVFIGHGHSAAWHKLKDFIKDRLKLPTDEFNSEPTAGATTFERLEQMLSSAAVAFLVMTAEDQQGDGKSHPRLNVVHETGLFQGRLGPKRAIILMEEGCEEFSNIAGLGQLRFRKGEITSTFEDIRQILEQAGLLRAGDLERGPTG